jgi:hypothetical protein
LIVVRGRFFFVFLGGLVVSHFVTFLRPDSLPSPFFAPTVSLVVHYISYIAPVDLFNYQEKPSPPIFRGFVRYFVSIVSTCACRVDTMIDYDFFERTTPPTHLRFL